MMWPGGDAGACAAHHGRWTDLLKAQHAEQLAEAVEPLLQQRGDDLVRAVSRRDARAAREDDRLHAGARELALQRPPHQIRIVLQDCVAGDDVAGGCQQVGNRAAAGVGLFRPRVADGDDETVH